MKPNFPVPPSMAGLAKHGICILNGKMHSYFVMLNTGSPLDDFLNRTVWQISDTGRLLSCDHSKFTSLKDKEIGYKKYWPLDEWASAFEILTKYKFLL